MNQRFRILSLTNFLYFAGFFYYIDIYQLYPGFFSSFIIPYLAVFLVIDLGFTLFMLDGLYEPLNDLSYRTLLVFYGVLSFVSRVGLIDYFLDFIPIDPTFLWYIIGITSLVFGILLLRAVSPYPNFQHKEKLKFVGIAQFSSLGLLIPTVISLNLFLGIKLFLPLVASLVYLLISYDAEFDEINSKEFKNTVET